METAMPNTDRQETGTMSASARDLALRADLKQLSVHTPCGGIRGPVSKFRDLTFYVGRWQSCPCEDAPVKWPECDVSRAFDLCTLCLRATAGGTIRWSWDACDTCRAVNDGIGAILGRSPLALGRHSLMNETGVGLNPDVDPRLVAKAHDALNGVVTGWEALSTWSQAEFARMAGRGPWGPNADVPLTTWLETYPSSMQASRGAFTRFTGLDPDELSAD
jgi:hypothetical protein